MPFQAGVFEDAYTEARRHFLAERAGVATRSLSADCDAKEGLWTDIALAGDPAADNVLVLVSGTHGPELPAGSACQTDFLDRFAAGRMPANTAAVLIHAVNAYGAALGFRCTEENIDLNRNFMPFQADSSLESVNAAYGEADFILERALEGADERFVDAAYLELRAKFGDRLEDVLFRGQYRAPRGLGFGGSAPSAARRRFESILADFCKAKRRVCLIDFHSGLGPYGVGSVFSLATGRSAYKVKEWFGDEAVLVNAPESPLPYKVTGDLSFTGASHVCACNSFVGAALEFGTHPSEGLVRSVLREYLIRRRASAIDDAFVRQAMAETAAFFHPHDHAWREAILERSRDLIERALVRLSA